MKKTPLYEQHINLGGKIIDFGGWALAVQYQGIVKEHLAVRSAAGLFDVSHMGEIFVEGEGARAFVQNIITNDISTIEDYGVIYSPMCYPSGGIVDDLLVYKYSDTKFLLVVNASNTDKDFEWLIQNKTHQVQITNVSGDYAQFALQGPSSQVVLQKLTDYPLQTIKFFHFAPSVNIAGFGALVSRTGYTGEDGFEIYLPSEFAPDMWQAILSAGEQDGLVPVGLGARDTLRFEVALPLYGNELSADISPLEARLSFFVKLDSHDFIGKAALLAQKQNGVERKLIGFEFIERGIARGHEDIESDGKKIGFVTSGSFSPSLNKSLGLGLISSAFAQSGSEIDIVIRDKRVKAKIVDLPFYKKRYNK
jgi:aminomethyltransferase